MTFGVYVRSVERQLQFYTLRGKWRIAFGPEVDYVVKRFVSPDELAPVLPYFPTTAAELSGHMQSAIEGGVPRELGAALLDKMTGLTDRILSFYRENSVQLDRMHETVADDMEKRTFTLAELASKALDAPQESFDEAALLAVHWTARRHPYLIEDDKSSMFTDLYLVQPKRLIETIDRVTTWVQEHEEYSIANAHGVAVDGFEHHPLETFLRRARRIIKHTREHREAPTLGFAGPTRNERGEGEPPVRELPGIEGLNQKDRTIVEYLMHFAIPPRLMTAWKMKSTGSYIMRATGMYSGSEAHAGVMPVFLQELGVIAPWEDLRLLDQMLCLPGHGVSKDKDNWWSEVQDRCKDQAAYTTDSMQGLRKDWGSLPVYCVDDPGAEEIDDGISVEQESDGVWVRVHVANPTAFIPHDDTVAKYALDRVQSIYTTERTYPIFPSAFTHERFSLAAGRPTLTFSAKLNRDGDVLDTNVTSGIIRDVRYISHATVRQLFVPNSQSARLTVGGTLPESREKPAELPDEDKSNFTLLRQLMTGVREHRRRNGAIEGRDSEESRILINTGEPLSPYNVEEPQRRSRLVIGDPIISLAVSNADPHEVVDRTKTDLVSTVMNLACWVAAKYLADRNIPTVYSGTWYHPEYPPLTNTNVHSAGGGENWRSFAPPKSVSSSTPVKHMGMGLDAYTKATSPLRRTLDCLAHYQIEAGLRFEATHARPLDASSPEDAANLPFAKSAVDAFIVDTRHKFNRIRDLQRSSRQFWACQLLHRAFYFGENPDLPDTFPVLVQNPYSSTPLLGTEYDNEYIGEITSLGVRCALSIPAGMEGVQVMGLVEAKIKDVDMSRQLVLTEATRVLSGFRRFGERA